MTAMIEMIDTLGWQCLKVLSITSSAIYLGLVVLGYATDGPRYQIKLDSAYPFRSAARLLVGSGVRIVAFVLRMVNVLLDPLYEASAMVGERFAGQSCAEAQARYQSRFI